VKVGDYEIQTCIEPYVITNLE